MGNYTGATAILDASRIPPVSKVDGQRIIKVLAVTARHAVHEPYATFLPPQLFY